MDMILKNTFQSISPAYELIGDVTVGTAKTQVDFTGLNIGKDDELLLVGDWVNGISSTNYLNLFFNSNNTPSNYYRQTFVAWDDATVCARSALALITQAVASSKSQFVCSTKLANSGYSVWQSSSVRAYGGDSPVLENDFGTSTFTTSSVTSLSIVSSVTNAIGIGSRFQLYKLVAEKVADIIVPSNTTSVDITGLNISKDGEYYLVSDVVSGANSDYYLYANDNVTATNYYVQRLTANSSTESGARVNNPSMVDASSGNKTLIMSNLKLTNSGYVVAQSNSVENYGGSGIILNKYYSTSTFTASSMTKFTITASATNGIATDSRFQLYKMK